MAVSIEAKNVVAETIVAENDVGDDIMAEKVVAKEATRLLSMQRSFTQQRCSSRCSSR